MALDRKQLKRLCGRITAEVLSWAVYGDLTHVDEVLTWVRGKKEAPQSAMEKLEFIYEVEQAISKSKVLRSKSPNWWLYEANMPCTPPVNAVTAIYRGDFDLVRMGVRELIGS